MFSIGVFVCTTDESFGLIILNGPRGFNETILSGNVQHVEGMMDEIIPWDCFCPEEAEDFHQITLHVDGKVVKEGVILRKAAQQMFAIDRK